VRTPLFSIVIPTYNRSELVISALRSVLQQTFEDFEIIVSDNCSQDDTPRVIREFNDPRLKYVRTPHHLVIADNWEFGRSKATGKLILMLADDDALVLTALEQFASAFRSHKADFLFCNSAEYFDGSYQGPGSNTLKCPSYSGSTRTIDPVDFLKPLFSCRPKFRMHPSAFVFARTLADLVASRCGRFFKTNGVEFFAWPLAAVFANKIIHIDAPLSILGRTAKSWGANLILCNPGKKRIEEFTSDASQERNCAPLSNFSMVNLMAEGILTAKKLFPEEFQRYAFDELSYLRRTVVEFRKRQSLGVDVSQEMDELQKYLQSKYPSMREQLFLDTNSKKSTPPSRIRLTVGKLGVGRIRQRVNAYRELRKVRRGQVDSGFRISGGDFGFYDTFECAQFLTGVLSSSQQNGR